VQQQALGEMVGEPWVSRGRSRGQLGDAGQLDERDARAHAGTLLVEAPARVGGAAAVGRDAGGKEERAGEHGEERERAAKRHSGSGATRTSA
jgi:hypothetical protein